MGDLDVCVSACRSFGVWGEALGFALVLGRLIWAEVKRRSANVENKELKATTTELERDNRDLVTKVRELSDRPPAYPIRAVDRLGGLLLHLPGASLEPPAHQPETQESLRPKSDSERSE